MATRWSDTCDLAHYLPIDPQRYYGINAHIEAIHRPAAPDVAEWVIEYVSRTRDKGDETRCKLRIDAAADWSVVREEDSSPDEHTESRRTLGNVWGRRAPIEMVEHTTNKSGASTFQLRVRELSRSEAAGVREQAENIARRRPATKWYAALIQPLPLAIAWPATGLLLLVAGVVMGRRSIPNVTRKSLSIDGNNSQYRANYFRRDLIGKVQCLSDHLAPLAETGLEQIAASPRIVDPDQVSSLFENPPWPRLQPTQARPTNPSSKST